MSTKPDQAQQRRLGKEKVPVYACATYHRKGTTVCDNRIEVRMDDLDGAVITSLEAELMNPEVVSSALRYVLADI